MAKGYLKDYTYAEVLVTPGYDVDFAVGTTYSLNPKAVLIVPMALGMLSDLNDANLKSKICILESIRRSADRFALFCNRGGVHIPSEVQNFFPLLENCIFEVQNKKKPSTNFHPKIWVIREVNRENPDDVQMKLVVMSRNLTLDNNLDMVVSLTGKVNVVHSTNSEKHEPLVNFLYGLAKFANKEKRTKIKGLADDLYRVERFEVDEENFARDGYEFIPLLFGVNLNTRVDVQDKDYSELQGKELFAISPFLDDEMVKNLNRKTESGQSILVTTSGYVSKSIYDLYNQENRSIYVMREQAQDNEIMPVDLHAKTYLVYRNGYFLYVGSANATSPAFHGNSEFLLRLQYKPGKHNVFSNFANDFLQVEGKEQESLWFEPVMVCPEEEESHVPSALEKFIRKFLAQDFKAVCQENEDGSYDVQVTMKENPESYKMEIAPLQNPNFRKVFSDTCVLDRMCLEQLSEFYILFFSDGETEEKRIVKIPTEGLPSAQRDIAIYKSVINSKEKFLNYISFILSDDPESFLFELKEAEKLFQHESKGNQDHQVPVRIYEQMLKLTHDNPKRIKSLEDIVNKLDDEDFTQDFLKVYNVFKSFIR